MRKPRIGDNPWIALRKAWIRALRGQSVNCTALAQSTDCATHTCVRVFGSLKRAGSCIMVDRNDFEEYLSSSFVQKKKSGSKLMISSLYTSLSSSATRQICSQAVAHHPGQSKITVRMKNVQSQSGGKLKQTSCHSCICCVCSESYTDNVLYGHGEEWVKCGCGRINEKCI